LLGETELASYSTGLYNEEGYSYCKRRTGRRAGGPSRTIAITICDRDALEPTAKWWGLPVRPRGGRALTCRDGPAYRIEASGLRAELIMKEMMKFGLSLKKKQQWNRVLERCGRKADSVAQASQFATCDKWLPLQEGLPAFYSTGLFNGGGCSTCARSGRRTNARIQVHMCDLDALEPVAKWWGVRVCTVNSKVKVCACGPSYKISASGARAEMIVREMMKHGLSNRKTQQWRKVLSQS
jgi:hypothetical protein